MNRRQLLVLGLVVLGFKPTKKLVAVEFQFVDSKGCVCGRPERVDNPHIILDKFAAELRKQPKYFANVTEIYE